MRASRIEAGLACSQEETQKRIGYLQEKQPMGRLSKIGRETALMALEFGDSLADLGLKLARGDIRGTALAAGNLFRKFILPFSRS